MNERFLCIHGHFYQPPREDPWMDLVQPEGTAAPAANWNERIVRESYAPLAWARRLDGRGRITELINCYEWINFNIGPTLLVWLERHEPDLYARILQADRRSVLRFGHGNAMAQVYHHAIMPLMSARDKEVEVAWAVQDFTARFGREPEGMWLAETAVDTPTLEVLADYGVGFTILAPRQAAALDDGAGMRSVIEQEVDITRPWRVELPSGRSMGVFFYNGPLSRSVAFEGLLQDGERFWRRLVQNAGQGLTSIGTDGETYGHHYPFGEMALAYVLDMARSGRDDVRLTNYASYLAAHPPTATVRLHEASSWSCVHGVERWRSDCGCSNGGHPGWHQRWRAPLRDGLDAVKKRMDEHFISVGAALFPDPHKALISFGMLVSGSMDVQTFKETACESQISLDNFKTALRLLSMQQWALSMYASCAWFFDDMARVEPRNALTFALRAMELAEDTGAGDLRPLLVEQLSRAEVNDERFDTGADLWRAEVLPRAESTASLVAQALLLLAAGEGLPAEGEARVAWPGLEVRIRLRAPQDPASADASVEPAPSVAGEAELHWQPGGGGPRCTWQWQGRDLLDLYAGTVAVDIDDGTTECVEPSVFFWKSREMIALEWLHSRDERRWEELLASGQEALPLFLEYRAYQSGPVHGEQWLTRWAELAAAYVVHGFSGPGEERLKAFLHSAHERQPSMAWLQTRLGAELVGLVEDRAGTGPVAAFQERARALGLTPQSWQAQNLAWEMAENGEGQGLLPLLGFAGD